MKRLLFFYFFFQVRVVHGLADCDFQDTSVMELLSDFIAELVNDGELMLARALRTKFIQKYEDRKLRLLPELDTSGLSFSHKTGLLSFKSMDLAEQMTLLDAQLFLRLDSAELILWVQVRNFNYKLAVSSWSIFMRAVIDHMTCYNFNWPKIKL